MNRLRIKKFVSNYWILLLLVSIKFVVQFVVVNPIYELHRDEFLHLNQAKHLAFGFISVPPLTSLFSVAINCLGGSLFWVRFFPAMFGVLTVVFAWLIVEELQGKLFAKILVASLLVFSVYMRINILYQPNSFDILAWTMVFFFVVKYIRTLKTKWIAFAFLSVVLGFYNKYNILFLCMGLTIGILFSSHRNIFSKKVFWKITILAFVLLLPNLIWQVTYHFPVLKHLQALNQNQLAHNSLLGFFKGQAVIISAFALLVLLALIAFCYYTPFKPYRIIGIAFISILILFACCRAKDYYALGVYPVMIAFGGVYFEKLFSGRWLRYIRPLPIILNLTAFLIIVPYLFPILSPEQIVAEKAMFEKIGLLKWEDGNNHQLPQDFSDMLGWKEMAHKVALAYKTIPKQELEQTIIFCDNYGQCGALNYYNQSITPESYACNTDHVYWLPQFKNIRNIVLVGKKPDKEVLEYFTECKYFGKVESEYSREKGTAIYILKGSKQGFTNTFYKVIAIRKAKFDIF